jgi:ribosomal protein S18 acetylase RimI-like enzyme
MNHMIAVRRFAAGDAAAVAAIIRGLPDYFTDDVPAKLDHDAARHQAWVLTDSGTVAGIAVAARKSPGGAEILWFAIDAARRGRGHGTRLLGHVLGGWQPGGNIRGRTAPDPMTSGARLNRLAARSV